MVQIFDCGTKEQVAANFHHHGSVKALWEHDWEFKCKIGVYPFNEGRKYDDFPPVINSMIEKGIENPLDERWPAEFLPHIMKLKDEGMSILESQPKEAAALFLRAAAMCHLARFPVLCTDLRREIWEIQKECYYAGASTWENPSVEVPVPFKHKAENDPGTVVPVLLRIPKKEAALGPVPVLLLTCGLDGFHIEMPTAVTDFCMANGWAIVAIDEPGTADCPGDRNDPESPDRVTSSVLDFIADHPQLDEKKTAVWGFSTGAYYALRMAHTHADRLLGSVGQGAHTHYALSPEWIDRMDVGEYPSTLTESLLDKFGYKTVEEMKADGQKRFSLIDSGIADMKHCKILLINGTEDTIYPVEDSYVMMAHGGVKEARFFEGLAHMAEPKASPFIFDWLKNILAPPTAPAQPNPTIEDVEKVVAENEALRRALKQLQQQLQAKGGAAVVPQAPASPPSSSGNVSDEDAEDVDPLEAQAHGMRLENVMNVGLFTSMG